MRRLFHLGIAASLLFSFAQAPFQHAHASDPHHEHARGFTHTHLGTALPDSLAWRADDHDSDARAIHWLAGDGSAPAKFVAAPVESVKQIVLTVHAIRSPELKTHNHDPPWRLLPTLRGPPA